MITAFKIKDQEIYIVKEVIHSFRDTKITKWYYDMDKLLISEDPNFPTGMLTRKLSEEQIKWFNDYYLPKAKEI